MDEDDNEHAMKRRRPKVRSPYPGAMGSVPLEQFDSFESVDDTGRSEGGFILEGGGEGRETGLLGKQGRDSAKHTGYDDDDTPATRAADLAAAAAEAEADHPTVSFDVDFEGSECHEVKGGGTVYDPIGKGMTALLTALYEYDALCGCSSCTCKLDSNADEQDGGRCGRACRVPSATKSPLEERQFVQAKSQSSSERDDFPPAVVPLSPDDLGKEEDCEEEDKRERDVMGESIRCHRCDAARFRCSLEWEEERKRVAQRVVAREVFAHPVSMRSYCLDAKDYAKRFGCARRHRVNCPDDHAGRVTGEEVKERLGASAGPLLRDSLVTSLSPLAIDTPCDCCHSQEGWKGLDRRYRRKLNGDGVVKQMRYGNYSRGCNDSCLIFNRGDFRWWTDIIIQSLLDLLFENAPVSTCLQALDGLLQILMEVLVSVFRLSRHAVGVSVGCAVTLTCGTYRVVSRQLVSLFCGGKGHVNHPWVTVANVADHATEAIASGIQSVAEGVGSTKKSASAVLQQYLSAKNISRKASASSMTGTVGPASEQVVGSTSAHSSGGISLVPSTSRTRSKTGGGVGFFWRTRSEHQPVNNAINEKLFRRLSRIDSGASRVISYTEMSEDVLSQRARQRVQRMMHYDVSLKPFVATVMAPGEQSDEERGKKKMCGARKKDSRKRQKSSGGTASETPALATRARADISAGFQTRVACGSRPERFGNLDFPSSASVYDIDGSTDDDEHVSSYNYDEHEGEEEQEKTSNTGSATSSPESEDDASDDEEYALNTGTDSDSETFTSVDEGGSPFMCTPKSFPPSPSSRSMVMARGTRFAEDVIFLARDQLRVEHSLSSTDDRTRTVAAALRRGRRLAVFSADDASGSGGAIALTCGQHCATKVGNVLYCTTRSMIPVLRNCYVYFEMSVSVSLPPSSAVGHHYHHQPHVAASSTMSSLAIGLSTAEMPQNTLVGAWKSSVGVCSTGQILCGGQWYSPTSTSLDPPFGSAYGFNSTVGCLVRLDDDSAFETWDGVVVTASVWFNVDGRPVIPPACLAPPGVAIGSFGVNIGPPADVSRAGSVVVDNCSFQLEGESAAPAVAQASGTTPGVPFHLHPSSSPLVASIPLFVPREEELFPTLTLHSPGTQVMCRFCAEDILAETRESMGGGLPRNVAVYAVDGSIILRADEDLKQCSSNFTGRGEGKHVEERPSSAGFDAESDSGAGVKIAGVGF